MNVIFLDFNGVLDTYEEMDIINYDNLMRLKNIVLKTNSKVVISSSIKNTYFRTCHFSELLKYVIKCLNDQGIEVIGITIKAETRENEIKIYLEDHPEIENFCIIDDDYNMTLFKEHMIKLPLQFEKNPYGLDDESMNKAIKILNNELLISGNCLNKTLF